MQKIEIGVSLDGDDATLSKIKDGARAVKTIKNNLHADIKSVRVIESELLVYTLIKEDGDYLLLENGTDKYLLA